MSAQSNASSRLSTPWVEGCCGPILTVSNSRLSGSASSLPKGATPSVVAICLPCHREIDGLGPERLRASQGVATPVVGEHDPPRIGVALELDAKQVEELAFVPVRARHDRGDAGRLTVGARFEPQP